MLIDILNAVRLQPQFKASGKHHAQLQRFTLAGPVEACWLEACDVLESNDTLCLTLAPMPKKVKQKAPAIDKEKAEFEHDISTLVSLVPQTHRRHTRALTESLRPSRPHLGPFLALLTAEQFAPLFVARRPRHNPYNAGMLNDPSSSPIARAPGIFPFNTLGNTGFNTTEQLACSALCATSSSQSPQPRVLEFKAGSHIVLSMESLFAGYNPGLPGISYPEPTAIGFRLIAQGAVRDDNATLTINDLLNPRLMPFIQHYFFCAHDRSRPGRADELTIRTQVGFDGFLQGIVRFGDKWQPWSKPKRASAEGQQRH